MRVALICLAVACVLGAPAPEEVPEAPVEEVPEAPVEEVPEAPVEEVPEVPVEEVPEVPLEEEVVPAPAVPAPVPESPAAPVRVCSYNCQGLGGATCTAPQVTNVSTACVDGTFHIVRRCNVTTDTVGEVRCVHSNGRLTPLEISAIMDLLLISTTALQVERLLRGLGNSIGAVIGECGTCWNRDLRSGGRVACLSCLDDTFLRQVRGRPAAICSANDEKCLNEVACSREFNVGRCFGVLCNRKCHHRSKKGLLGLLGLLGLIPLCLCLLPCLLWLLCCRKRKPKVDYVPQLFPTSVMPMATMPLASCAPIAAEQCFAAPATACYPGVMDYGYAGADLGACSAVPFTTGGLPAYGGQFVA